MARLIPSFIPERRLSVRLATPTSALVMSFAHLAEISGLVILAFLRTATPMNLRRSVGRGVTPLVESVVRSRDTKLLPANGTNELAGADYSRLEQKLPTD